MIGRVVFIVIEQLVRWTPYPVLVGISKLCGWVAFYIYPPFRKKALTNLTLVYGVLRSERDKRKIAIGSFQNLALTCLEYFKLDARFIQKRVVLESDPALVEALEKQRGMIFFSGHLGNWEIPFLKATQSYQGIAIAKLVKPAWLNQFLLRKREMFKGKIISPRCALSQGIRALHAGTFVGIVGDQALPESSYAYPLFGIRAWTSTAPALLAYKTNTPLVVIVTKRENGKHFIRHSKLMYPNLAAPLSSEVTRLMDNAMAFLESYILDHPTQWMWLHDRWKQQKIDHIKREYRFGFILVIVPPGWTDDLSIFSYLYPRSFLSFLLPQGDTRQLKGEVFYYCSEKECLLNGWKFQMVIDLSNNPRLRRYYLTRGVFMYLNGTDFWKDLPFDERIKHKLCKLESLLQLPKYLRQYE